VVQVRWKTNWLQSSPGNDAGTAHLGCRPATVIARIHQDLYLPLGVTPALGRCGFCITGNSGGSTQVSYALTHYGLEGLLDGVMPTGGPPHAALRKSCLGEPGYDYPLATRQFLDQAFGYFSGNGPCALRDAAFTPRWDAEAVATGGTDYHHPRTRVHFVIGASDTGMQVVSADYSGRLRSAGTPMLAVEIAPNTPHNVMSTVQGRAALMAAILSGPTRGPEEPVP
jgi:hypothetical protein